MQDLTALCSPHGTVKAVWIAPRNGVHCEGVGAVVMDNALSALDVFERVDGTVLKGNAVRTSYSDLIFPNTVRCPKQFMVGLPKKEKMAQMAVEEEEKRALFERLRLKIKEIKRFKKGRQRIKGLVTMENTCRRKGVCSPICSAFSGIESVTETLAD